MKALLLLVVSGVFLNSCGSIKPLPPDLPPSQISSTPLPDSRIDLPVTINLSQVFNEISSSVPAQFAGEGTAVPAQYRWNVQRQPFNLSLSGDSLHIIDAAHFTGGGYLKNPLNGKWTKVCACNADATIGIQSRFDLFKNYSLSAKLALVQFDLNACNLNVINFNVTPLIKAGAAAAISQQLAALNQQINKFNFRSLLQPAWAALYQPIKIADIGYIVINPSAIRLSRPSGSGNVLKLSAGITARPVFYLNNPGKIEAGSLPDLSDAASGSGFNLNMDAHLDYKPLNELLKTTIASKKINVSANSYLVINDAEIYGSGNDHLLIKVNFTGKQGAIPYHGILYFTCFPVYNVASGDLYINNIDFDVNTITKLKEGPASWILGSAIKKYLGTQVHFNVGNQINSLKDKLSEAINRPVDAHVTLAGKVDSLSLQGILPLKDYILVRVSTSGSLEAKVN